ncbi:hypothetical protein PAHAL_2G433600 [Panicum hallii]|uniref:Uncharacterized protein n=1 Tax=Panicum hallii TaxID=206008 RepID=A0A2T8KSL5_9POAL|nr:hypothetical protein PAHAL_2G433600 [Panicum hallii]
MERAVAKDSAPAGAGSSLPYGPAPQRGAIRHLRLSLPPLRGYSSSSVLEDPKPNEGARSIGDGRGRPLGHRVVIVAQL